MFETSADAYDTDAYDTDARRSALVERAAGGGVEPEIAVQDAVHRGDVSFGEATSLAALPASSVATVWARLERSQQFSLGQLVPEESQRLEHEQRRAEYRVAIETAGDTVLEEPAALVDPARQRSGVVRDQLAAAALARRCPR